MTLDEYILVHNAINAEAAANHLAKVLATKGLGVPRAFPDLLFQVDKLAERLRKKAEKAVIREQS